VSLFWTERRRQDLGGRRSCENYKETTNGREKKKIHHMKNHRETIAARSKNREGEINIPNNAIIKG